MNIEETKKITGILSDAGKTFRTLDSGVLSMISEDEETKTLIKTFNNTKVRAGEKIKNTKMHTAGLIAYIYDKAKNDVEKVKRPQNKEVKQQNMDRLMKVFRSQASKLVTIFDMQNLLVDAKDMIIRKLEKAKGVASTFVRTSKGYKVTKVEGFVAIDQVGKAVKLVDRLEFAHQNFNAAKNWAK